MGCLKHSKRDGECLGIGLIQDIAKPVSLVNRKSATELQPKPSKVMTMSTILEKEHTTIRTTASVVALYYSMVQKVLCVGRTLPLALCAYMAHKRAQRQLRALDDRMLKDIGIDRSEIDSVLLDCAGERRRGLDPTHNYYF